MPQISISPQQSNPYIQSSNSRQSTNPDSRLLRNRKSTESVDKDDYPGTDVETSDLIISLFSYTVNLCNINGGGTFVIGLVYVENLHYLL
jgi:hypothetical protein